MKIISLEVENVMRLKAVRIDADGTVQVVTGKNGAGKSSVLDAIWLALGGGAASREIKEPLNKDADEGFVKLDLGEFVVTRTWKGETTGLKVQNADGSMLRSPQKTLSDLVGQLAFDPLAFTELSAREQRDALIGLVELPFDPVALDGQREDLFTQRTDVNRKLRDLRGQLADAPRVDAPDVEVAVADIVAELEQARANNAEIAQLENTAREAEELAKSLERRMLELQEQLNQACSKAENADETLRRLNPVDEQPILERLNTVDETNKRVRAKKERERLVKAVDSVEGDVRSLTKEIEKLDKVKADGLAQAEFPVDGLGFDESGVTYNGVTFAQASAAEKMRVSTAMAMALNPELRVIRIKDGSLMDDDTMGVLREMAEGKDYQLWIERVGTSAEGSAVLIVDGEVG